MTAAAWLPCSVQEAGLRAIASPRRREILASHFDVSWPAISQNLRVLEDVGFVRSRRAGTTRLYRADRARLGPLRPVLVKMWEADLDRLAELAEGEARRGKR